MALGLTCERCGQFLSEAGGIHQCPGKGWVPCTICSHERDDHLVVANQPRAGAKHHGNHYGRCAARQSDSGLWSSANFGPPCACIRYRAPRRAGGN